MYKRNYNLGGNMNSEDEYGTFEIYKRGGKVQVEIVNKEMKFDKDRYRWLLNDFDRDGTANVDDEDPYNRKNNQLVDTPSLKKGLTYLLDLKRTMDKNMYSFVRKLKDVAPSESKIYARTKTPYSIINKLILKRLLNPKTGLTDLIGTTIVVKNRAELENVKDEISSGKLGKVIEFEDMYANPKNGYRAYHFLIEMNNMPVELQLKTARQKALNQLSHEPYKVGQLDGDKLIQMTEIADKADSGDKLALKQYDEFMNQPNVERAFYTSNQSKMAYGGKIKSFIADNAYRYVPSNSIPKELLEKVNYSYLRPYFVGNFSWKVPQKERIGHGDGYLFSLDDFDKRFFANQKLKEGEYIFRYITYTTAIGGFVLPIKININRGLAYFPEMEGLNDEIVHFETKGVKLDYLNLVDDFGSSKMSKGGMTENYEFLVGKRVFLYTMGVKDPNAYTIKSVRLTSPKFSNQDLIISLGENTEERIPLSKVADFLKGKEVSLRDIQGESYALKLVESQSKQNMSHGGNLEPISFEELERMLEMENSVKFADGGVTPQDLRQARMNNPTLF